ncbi:hypothetical protein [Ferruginibacter sp. SUN106]|uniref:hypothetical protein n=1 Tax=Ferruginibacter sp. SUN106 TaxID=2978348 RepID=UPI003D36C9D4
MKKIISLVIAIIIVNFTYSQSTNELDKKNGINKFKLGTSYEVYKKDLTFIMTTKETGCKMYKYTGPNIVVLLGSIYEEISLLFYKQKLYSINIYYTNLLDPDGIKIRKRLTVLFGQPKSVNLDNFDWAYRWTGEKVILGWDKVSCNSDYKPCVHMAWVTSQAIRREVEGGEF